MQHNHSTPGTELRRSQKNESQGRHGRCFLVAIPIVPDLMALDVNACWLHHTERATQNVGAWECAHRTWFRDRHWRSLCLDGMHDVAGIGGCSDPRETCVMRRSQIAGFCGVPLLSLLYGYNQTQSDLEHTHNMVSAPTACEPAAQNRSAPCARAYPDINVVGLPKAGSTALYALLAAHPRISPLDDQKEYCARNWLNRMSDERWCVEVSARCAMARTALVVNGCLAINEHIEMARRLQSRRARFIVAVRDPADWLWSWWNYFLDENDAISSHGLCPGAADPVACVRASTHVSESTFRPASYFHELVASNGKLKNSAKYTEDGIIRAMEISRLIELKRLVGTRLLVVKTEAMYSAETIEKLAGHLSIDPGGFTSATNSHPRSNSNQRKHTMLNVTRQLLYFRARPACQMVAQHLQLSLGCELTSAAPLPP